MKAAHGLLSNPQMSPAELRALIGLWGMERRQFADFLGVSQRSVYAWLSGRTPVPLWVLRFLSVVKCVRGFVMVLKVDGATDSMALDYIRHLRQDACFRRCDCMALGLYEVTE